MDFCVWNRCNNRCVMCTNPVGFDSLENSKPYAYELLVNRLNSFRDQIVENGEPLCLTGGEPTIHPDFLKFVKWFRREFPDSRIHLATNGRLFSYDKFAREYIDLGNLAIEVPIHGHTAALHDAVTRVPGSFDQMVAGVENILKYKRRSDFLELRVILTKLTYGKLDKILEFISNKFPTAGAVVIIFPELEGLCADSVDSVGLSYGEVKEGVSKAVEQFKDRFRDLRLYHFPLCTIYPKLWPNTWRTLRGEEITYLDKCGGCSYREYCLGVHVDYLELKGGGEFNPIKEDIKIELDSENPFHHPIKKVY